MKHHLPPLDAFKAFETTARLMSFTRAAEELCVSKGAVSHQVKKLEAHLGQALFKRTTRQILLTDSGQVLFQHTQHWFAQLNNQLSQLQQKYNDTLTIAVTTYTAVRWLSPRLAAYRQQHPTQQITLQHNVNNTQAKDNRTDVRIRWQYNKHNDKNNKHNGYFILAPLFPVMSAQQASQLNIAPKTLKQGQLNTPPWQDLNLLCEACETDVWQLWNNHKPIHNTRQIIDDANVRVQAAVDGSGIILADQLMQTELDAGLLIELSHQRLQGTGYGIEAFSTVGDQFVNWLVANTI